MSGKKKGFDPEKAPYDIGFGKTPKDTRWKPGKSGNEKGRPKGSKNLKTDLEEELSEMIEFTERGQRKSCSKRRAIIKQLTAKAAKGDVRSAALILKYDLDAGHSRPSDSDDDDLTETEAKRLEDYVLREAKKLKDAG